MKTLAASVLLLGSSLAFAAATPGAAAPDFKLKDTEGKTVSLSDFKGKVVVLEWFNPECPFVRAAHTNGSLVGLAKKHTDKGVVWLAINSAAPGKQGFGPEKTKAGAKKFGMEHPLLLDETGTVGHAYGATNTPHLFVINKDGTVAYTGGIDNSPDGEKGEPEGGKLVNYVDQALADLAAGKPVQAPTSKAYGCSVKYGG
jgi:peroxiredoxin